MFQSKFIHAGMPTFRVKKYQFVEEKLIYWFSGQRYALLATKAAVVQILKNFELLPAEPKFTPEITNTAVLKTENGICIQLKIREH